MFDASQINSAWFRDSSDQAIFFTTGRGMFVVNVRRMILYSCPRDLFHARAWELQSLAHAANSDSTAGKASSPKFPIQTLNLQSKIFKTQTLIRNFSAQDKHHTRLS